MEQPGDVNNQVIVPLRKQAGRHPPVRAPVSLARQVRDVRAAVVAVPVLSLRPADSPRLNGEDKAHIARLAETETPLPPILVDRRTMRVIDGMHRLMAASLQGRETIDVIFFDGQRGGRLPAGSPGEHRPRPAAVPGRPPRRGGADHRVAPAHVRPGDRPFGGLAAKTVAAIRKSSSEEIPQSNARVGRDGKVRPLDSGVGRRRAAELLAQQPDASLRDVARARGHIPGDGSRRAQAPGARRVARAGKVRRERCPQRCQRCRPRRLTRRATTLSPRPFA